MNKIKGIILALIIMLPSVNFIAAGTTILFQHSANTYAKSYHGDNYFDDEYIGTIAVKGTDRLKGTYYYRWVSITYNVQGDYTSGIVTVNNSSDSTNRKKTIYAYDKWNLSPVKTKVNYNYQICRIGTGGAGQVACDVGYRSLPNDEATVIDESLFSPSETAIKINNGYIVEGPEVELD